MKRSIRPHLDGTAGTLRTEIIKALDAIMVKPAWVGAWFDHTERYEDGYLAYPDDVQKVFKYVKATSHRRAHAPSALIDQNMLDAVIVALEGMAVGGDAALDLSHVVLADGVDDDELLAIQHRWSRFLGTLSREMPRTTDEPELDDDGAEDEGEVDVDVADIEPQTADV
jgi:hypothetical protein